MNREALIDALARDRAERYEQDPSVHWSWNDDDMEEFRQAWRAKVAQDLPAIVDFVAAWLSNQSGVNVVAEDAAYLVQAWREDTKL